MEEVKKVQNYNRITKLAQLQDIINMINLPDFRQLEYSDDRITKVEEEILERRNKELTKEKECKEKFNEEMNAIEIIKYLS